WKKRLGKGLLLHCCYLAADLGSSLPQTGKTPGRSLLASSVPGRPVPRGGASSHYSDVIRHYCTKPGHFIDCLKRKADRQVNGGTGGGSGGGRHSYSYAPHHMTFAIKDNGSHLLYWHLDSESTWHVTYNESKLVDVQPLSPDKQLEIVCVGSQILIPMAVGNLSMHSNIIKNLQLSIYVYVAREPVVKIISIYQLDS
ncbi:hypothetical protein VaNZ11_016572, partial [Volvox africanus]